MQSVILFIYTTVTNTRIASDRNSQTRILFMIEHNYFIGNNENSGLTTSVYSLYVCMKVLM